MPFGQLIYVVRGYLLKREAEFIGAGRDVPEHVAEFVQQLRPRFVGYHAARVTLDLFDDIGYLARLTGEPESGVFQVAKPPRVESRLARFGLVFFISIATVRSPTPPGTGVK